MRSMNLYTSRMQVVTRFYVLATKTYIAILIQGQMRTLQLALITIKVTQSRRLKYKLFAELKI